MQISTPKHACPFAACVVLAIAGCASYQVGHQTLYRPDIQTIYIPIFENETYRRGLGEQVTEAVIKEVQQRTPYRVVHTPDADSTLSGRIVAERKRVEAENRFDDARMVEAEVAVDVHWTDRSGNVLMQRAGMPVPYISLSATHSSTFSPESGQSLATAQQDVSRRLAREIVGQMELWW